MMHGLSIVASTVAKQVANGLAEQGILFCWTGTEVCIAANKVPGIRAALCHDTKTVIGARTWNDANILILVLSLRALSEEIAKEMLDAWFATQSSCKEADLKCFKMIAALDKEFRSA